MLKPRIKVKLAELNKKQKELCEELDVTKQTLNSWVNGRSMPTLESAFKIAYILDCTVDELFEYIDEDE
ncbi:helix-turn-helix domain-containing protein [Cytobacillus kochii]|uniref:helix-turn-helix transcriptional regulator n=1 Tax=Cytobacillus kochii TaxID=859143 RepID=UPI001CD463EF|nr:helix-turn-helix domain-containing protein [Cytobacillus kochii]MCA1025692.1 helix-turn-helix domain-containing protein [Cytobacillus kochii]